MINLKIERPQCKIVFGENREEASNYDYKFSMLKNLFKQRQVACGENNKL